MPIAPARKKPRFPYSFEKNGRVGRIYKLGNGTFKTYFRYANSPKQNTHATFDAACYGRGAAQRVAHPGVPIPLPGENLSGEPLF